MNTSRAKPRRLPFYLCAALLLFLCVGSGLFFFRRFSASRAVKSAALELTVPSTITFHPLPLEAFYQRLLASYRTNEPFGAVPKGIVDFDGVPFRMFGKIEMNGLGPSRNNNFLPTRVGEIPMGRRVERLHLISGAGYKDPDGTPLAELRLHYANGETRNIFMSYGEHVRNWHVESDERRTDLSDRNSRIVWDGINGATGRPLRLFKNAFDNPLPAQEVRSIELLSLFGRAFPLFLAITVEDINPPSPHTPALRDDPDDLSFRREILVRVLDSEARSAITNASLEMSVTEGERKYRFGRHLSDAHGQILLDYPPGKFEAVDFSVTARGYTPLMLRHSSEEGIYPAEIPVRLNPVRLDNSSEPQTKR